MKVLSHKILSLELSGTLALADMAKKLKKENKPVVSLAAGEPDFDTPEHIKDAGIKALNEGITHYAPSRGYIELRKAIAGQLNEKKLAYDPATEILVTPGAKQGILTCLLATLNPDDEIIIPSPRWVSYSEAVKLVGAKPVYVKMKKNFQLDFEELEKATSPSTKLIILNSPNNPTGQIIPKEDIQKVAEWALETGCLVLSDEIYEKIVYDANKATSIATMPKMRNNTILISGFSKTYAMTGWRLGWIAAPQNIMDQMIKIQQHSVTSACSFSQMGGLTALEDPRSETAIKFMVNEFKKRRDFLTAELKAIPELEGIEPQGAFYYWLKLNLPKAISSYEFCQRLLKEKYVAVVPGSAFGSEGEGFLRMSFAAAWEDIKEAINRIKDFIKSLN